MVDLQKLDPAIMEVVVNKWSTGEWSIEVNRVVINGQKNGQIR